MISIFKSILYIALHVILVEILTFTAQQVTSLDCLGHCLQQKEKWQTNKSIRKNKINALPNLINIELLFSPCIQFEYLVCSKLYYALLP